MLTPIAKTSDSGSSSSLIVSIQVQMHISCLMVCIGAALLVLEGIAKEHLDLTAVVCMHASNRKNET